MPQARFALERRVSLAFLLALFLQGAGAVWWASDIAAAAHFRDRRLDALEQEFAGSGERQLEMLQRLARLEAQGDEARALLQRIETRLPRVR